MSMVISSELGSANSLISSAVSEYSAHGKSILGSIESFKNNSDKNLTGEAWNKILNTFVEHYTEIFNMSERLQNSFLDASKAANDSMQSWVDGFSYSYRGSEFGTEGDTYNHYVEQRNANKDYEETVTVKDYDKDHKQIGTHTETQIDETKKALYDEARNALEYLATVSSADSSAYGKLEAIDSDLSKFKSTSSNSAF